MTSRGEFQRLADLGRHLAGSSPAVPVGVGDDAAVVRVGAVEIILTEQRLQPFDAEVLRSVGIEPVDRKLIALKSAVHFRADYTPIAHAILEVDTPGVHSPNLSSYDYKKVRAVYPLSGEVVDWR